MRATVEVFERSGEDNRSILVIEPPMAIHGIRKQLEQQPHDVVVTTPFVAGDLEVILLSDKSLDQVLGDDVSIMEPYKPVQPLELEIELPA